MMNALNILPSYVDYFSLTAATIGLNSGIVWIGAIIGSILLAKVPDHIGRKPAMFYAAVIAIIGSILQGAAQNIAMFLCARFILGFGVGATYIAAPLLVAETLPTKYRAYGLGAFTDLYYCGGLLSAGTLMCSCTLTRLIRHRHYIWHRSHGVDVGLATAFLPPDLLYLALGCRVTLGAGISSLFGRSR